MIIMDIALIFNYDRHGYSSGGSCRHYGDFILETHSDDSFGLNHPLFDLLRKYSFFLAIIQTITFFRLN